MPHLEQQQQQQQQQQHRSEPPLCTHQYASAFGTYRKPTPVTHPLNVQPNFTNYPSGRRHPHQNAIVVTRSCHQQRPHVRGAHQGAATHVIQPPNPIPHIPHPLPNTHCLTPHPTRIAYSSSPRNHHRPPRRRCLPQLLQVQRHRIIVASAGPQIISAFTFFTTTTRASSQAHCTCRFSG